ncbi:MAG: hypothetical protein ACREMB_09815 [Candidatus Rokuibacteriota bacterium]
MAFLVVVKRSEPALFDYLRQHFQEPEVTVLMDRRHGERRQEGSAAALDRRRQDRRAALSHLDPLWNYGFRVALAQDGNPS